MFYRFPCDITYFLVLAWHTDQIQSAKFLKMKKFISCRGTGTTRKMDNHRIKIVKKHCSIFETPKSNCFPTYISLFICTLCVFKNCFKDDIMTHKIYQKLISVKKMHKPIKSPLPPLFKISAPLRYLLYMHMTDFKIWHMDSTETKLKKSAKTHWNLGFVLS